MKKKTDLTLSRIESLYNRKAFYETKKLEERCREVGIEPPTYQPVDNNVVCWRLPPLTISRGGIVLPEDAQSPHIKGILISVGPRARDVLFSNGIEVGDIVVWARFSGWEFHDKTAKTERGTEFVVLKDRDILGSDDLAVEIATGRAKYVLDEKTGRHNLVRKMLTGRKQKLLALAASTTSQAEADTARRIAAQEK